MVVVVLVSPNLLNSPKHHEFLPHHLVTAVQELVVDEQRVLEPCY